MSTLRFKLAAPATGRLRAVDELKGVAIILIVLYHAGGVLVWNNRYHLDLGVDLFVILSGVGLGFGARYAGPVTFLARRFSRIFPAYWLVLTLCWFANTRFLGEHYTAANLGIHYLGLQSLVGGPYVFSINDSFWFITLIAGLYLLYCAGHALVDYADKLLLFGAASSAIIAFLINFSPAHEGLVGFIATRVPGFFAGLLIGRLLKNGGVEFKIGPTLAIAALLWVYVPNLYGVVYYSPAAALALAGAYLLIFRRLAPAAVVERTGRILAFLGDRSLEIFLIHQPLIREYNFYVFRQCFHNGAPSTGLLAAGMAVGLGVTVALSTLLHWLLRNVQFSVPAPAPSSPA